MTAIERLVDLLVAQYRWGLHSFKLLAALLAPVLIVWLADRRVSALARMDADQEERIGRLPHVGRR